MGTQRIERPKPAPPKVVDVLQLFYDLGRAQQLEVYQAVRDYLGDGVGVETSSSKLLDGQALALDCLERAYAHLALDKQAKLTGRSYDLVAEQLDLPLTAKAIGEHFVSWRTAIDAYRGERIPRTAKQRVFTSAANINRHDPALARFALQTFLDSDPPSTTHREYMRWAHRYNALNPEGRVPASSCSIGEAIGLLTLSEAVRLLRGQPVKTSWDDEDFGDLVASLDAARLSGQKTTAIVERWGFPAPVVSVPIRFWLKEDVIAFRTGQPLPGVDREALAREAMTSADVAVRLGVETHYVEMLARKRAFHHVPPRWIIHRQTSLWKRSEVEAWLEEHPRPGGRSAKEPHGESVKRLQRTRVVPRRS